MARDPKSSYYDVGGIETLEIIKAKLTPEEYRGYLKGNAIKYLSRLGHKPDQAERDAEKAVNYVQWLRDEIKGQRTESLLESLQGDKFYKPE